MYVMFYYQLIYETIFNYLKYIYKYISIFLCISKTNLKQNFISVNTNHTVINSLLTKSNTISSMTIDHDYVSTVPESIDMA